jgi:hypothetical protein
MPNYYVVMADVIASRSREPQQLMGEFERLVNTANTLFSGGILSPLTITLGDEFQGVVKTLHDAVKVLVWLEEVRLRGDFGSQLRYVVHYGEITTPLNPQLAYGMLGPGLAAAREELSDKRRGRSRFRIELPDRRLASQLSQLLEVMFALTRGWKSEDASLLFDMMRNQNNEAVAVEHGKNRSQVWKRRRNLYVDEYAALKDVVLGLSEEGAH